MRGGHIQKAVQLGSADSQAHSCPKALIPDTRGGCRSVQRGQGHPITEQLRTRTPDRPPTLRHDRDLRICTLNCRTLSSYNSMAALEHSFEGIRYDEDINEHRIRVLTKAAEEKRSIKKAKQSLSRSRTPMDTVLDSSGAPITSRTGIEERVKEFYTNLFRSATPPSNDPLPILPSEEWCTGPEMSLGGDPLEETDAYVYLDRELRSNGTMNTELMRRKRAAWAAYGSIRDVTRVPGSQAPLIPLRLARPPRPLLRCRDVASHEVRPLFIETTHRALERSLIGTSLHSMRQKNMTSIDVRRISLLTDPIDYIRRAKHRWAGHVLRREDDRWSTRVTQLFPPPDVVRPSGRPPARLSDSIVEYTKMTYSTGRCTRLSSLRAPYQHWTTRARDINTWRDCDPRGLAR
ncbi:hypothetical protein PRIPAC_71990 [Pristionchus pacificus]|uniref:Uncharacterized protein n=1 Tax=Pristionchus pacificus TaxID=54126 RepID=A0A2A6CS92_PRIPA|nr:hypothetical protein PRIPAC_71990 [Pristionchus pacificus]|eukprot:PDM81082.1 hypothetical protein PRIPAC_36085 [Pristionchus pacificus]